MIYDVIMGILAGVGIFFTIYYSIKILNSKVRIR